MVDVLGRTVVVLDVLDGAAVKWWMFWAEHWYWSFWMEQLSNGGCFGRLVWVMKAGASPRATDGVLFLHLVVV